MLVFFNRHGEQISRKEWWDMIRNPEYTNIKTTEDEWYRVRTSWVGVATACEERPAIFVLTRRLLGKKKRDPKDSLAPEWFHTQNEALARHLKVMPKPRLTI